MKVLRVIGKIFAVILSITYFFLLSVLMLVGFSTNFISGNYYADVLKSIDLDEIKLTDIEENIDIEELDENASLEDALVYLLEESGVKQNVAERIIENKEIRQIVGNFIGDYINYNLGGEKPSISREDIKKVLTNKDVISAIGETPTDEDIDKIYSEFNNLVNEIVDGEGGDKNDSK